MQKNWIGKSVGCEIDFEIEGNQKVKIFTTRPDTIFGATFLALSVDHPLCKNFNEKEDFIKFKKQLLKLELRKKQLQMQKRLVLILVLKLNTLL